MLTNLLADLFRQWMSTVKMKDRMHHDLPPHFREEFQHLPWKRYQYFYGVLVPVIIHDALFRLHGTAITKNHRKVITAQAFLTGLFDDLFDQLHLPEARIRNLIETPEYIISSEFTGEHLCQYLYMEIYEGFTGHKKLLEDSVLSIIKAQEWSRQQNAGSLSLEKILEITRTKGGQAVLFYRSCIDKSLCEKEKEFLLHLGGLFQMTNDINDALNDQQAGESTIMTMGLSLLEIREIFDNQISQTVESWELLPEDKYHKKRFFSRINILVARSMVTLDRYARLSDPTASFDIRDTPENKVISGLKPPFELGRWLQYYSSIKKNSKDS